MYGVARKVRDMKLINNKIGVKFALATEYKREMAYM